MCDHRACTPLLVPADQLEDWVARAFEMVVAVRFGLLTVDHLYRITTPTLAHSLIAADVVQPVRLRINRQWCSAEFLALSNSDPPAYMGAVTRRAQGLRITRVQALPSRRVLVAKP